MKPATKTLLAFLLAIPALPDRSLAQSGPCANPSDPRIVVVALSTPPTKSDSSFYVRKREVELRLRDALAKKLSFACILTDERAISDPRNFPALRGTPAFEISAMPSVANPSVAAIAVQVSSVQGPFVENRFSMGVVPLLIEDGDSNFDTRAEEVTHLWKAMTEALTRSK